jgi:hypothetical protein
MNKSIEKIIVHPEMKKLVGSVLAIAAGFAAKKLITVILRKTAVNMVGTVVQTEVVGLVSRHPEWIDAIADRVTHGKSTVNA